VVHPDPQHFQPGPGNAPGYHAGTGETTDQGKAEEDTEHSAGLTHRHHRYQINFTGRDLLHAYHGHGS